MTATALARQEFFHSRRRRSISREGRLRLECDRTIEALLSEKDAEIKEQKKKIADFTKRDAKNAALVLQMQTENFFTQLELEGLRNAVRDLVETKKREEGALGAFAAEVERLKRDVEQSAISEALEYELSSEDWSEIIEA